jgi:hypothetical protein
MHKYALRHARKFSGKKLEGVTVAAPKAADNHQAAVKATEEVGQASKLPHVVDLDRDNNGWQIFDACLKSPTPVASGTGMASFVAALPDGECAWGIYSYDKQYLVRIRWRPDVVSGMC